ncbi:MAG: LacI family DNA-binding transcriptional regulator, partial [Burkholderiales bacterium]
MTTPKNPPGRPSVSSAEVARHAGVSRTTVSFV